MLTENVLDPDSTIVVSKRFPDEDPGTPDSFAGEYYFYNYDIRGSVTSIIAPHDIELPDDSTLQGGVPVAGYECDGYGNLENNATQGFLNETTYTGSVTDKSTGLQYMNARYYGQCNKNICGINFSVRLQYELSILQQNHNIAPGRA
jgi:hypothetical protein